MRDESYAGIGSRKTPHHILQHMQSIAMQLTLRSVTLRSGGAIGADTAFEWGCDMMRGPKRIYYAATLQSAHDHAAQFHPAWDRCSEYARALHARNSLIMLGDQLNDPVGFVVCWTTGGLPKGGTGQALRIAEHYKIPVCNLAIMRWESFDASR